jgi:hypothetical protein
MDPRWGCMNLSGRFVAAEKWRVAQDVFFQLLMLVSSSNESMTMITSTH